MAAADETLTSPPMRVDDNISSKNEDAEQQPYESPPKYVAVVWHNTPADNIDKQLDVAIVSYSHQGHNFYWLPYIRRNGNETAMETAVDRVCRRQLGLTVRESHLRLITEQYVDLTNDNISQHALDLHPWPSKFHITIFDLCVPSNHFYRLVPRRADSNYPVLAAARRREPITVIRYYISWRKLFHTIFNSYDNEIYFDGEMHQKLDQIVESCGNYLYKIDQFFFYNYMPFM